MKHEKLYKLENDLQTLYRLYPMYKAVDPFFNINFNQHRADFTLGRKRIRRESIE